MTISLQMDVHYRINGNRKRIWCCLRSAGIVVEKGFQNGGDSLREQGIRVESLAIVDSMTDDSVSFRKDEWIINKIISAFKLLSGYSQSAFATCS